MHTELLVASEFVDQYYHERNMGFSFADVERYTPVLASVVRHTVGVLVALLQPWQLQPFSAIYSFLQDGNGVTVGNQLQTTERYGSEPDRRSSSSSSASSHIHASSANNNHIAAYSRVLLWYTAKR